MKKYAILTYWAKGMSNGTAPDENGPARLNEGQFNSSHKKSDNTVADLIRNEEGKIIQFISQTFHAFSFGLFHIIAMRVILQNFAAKQQGRGQALYSTMWGLGVASGSILAGQYWEKLSGEYIFIIAGFSALLGLLLINFLPKTLQTIQR